MHMVHFSEPTGCTMYKTQKKDSLQDIFVQGYEQRNKATKENNCYNKHQASTINRYQYPAVLFVSFLCCYISSCSFVACICWYNNQCYKLMIINIEWKISYIYSNCTQNCIITIFCNDFCIFLKPRFSPFISHKKHQIWCMSSRHTIQFCNWHLFLKLLLNQVVLGMFPNVLHIVPLSWQLLALSALSTFVFGWYSFQKLSSTTGSVLNKYTIN